MYARYALHALLVLALASFLALPSLADTAAPAAPAGAPPVLLYRAAPAPMRDNTAVSLWLYGDGAGGNLRVRVMATSGRAGRPALVRGAGDDTEPLWPAWISAPIPLTFSGWKQIVLTRDQLTYRPPVGTAADSTPSLHFADADAVGIDTDRRKGAIYVDDIAWVKTDANGLPVGDATLVDNFEQGDIAAWTPHGSPEAVRSLVYGVTTTPAYVKEGRAALKLDFTQSAALAAAGQHRLAAAMAVNHQPYLVYVPDSPFNRELPDSTPQVGELKTSMRVFACSGQTQPASFCLYSKKPLTDVSVYAKTDLLGVGHKFNRSALDIYVVKVWDRDGIGPLRDPDAEGPTPELLMKDDREPLAMNGAAPPDIRLTGNPLTDIPAGAEKQFWVNVNVPADTPADNYTTELVVTAKEIKPIVVSLSVDVLPIRLLSASKQYAIGFRGKLGLPPDMLPSANGESLLTDYVSKDEFAAQLADIQAHGFRYATLTDTGPALWDAVDAYDQAGLGAPLVYDGLTGQDDMDTIKAIEQDRASHKDPSFFYVVPRSVDQPKEMAAMKDDGLESASFIPDQTAFDAVKDDLDLAIYPADESYAQKLLQTGGQRMFMNRDWWTWPSAQDDPQVNRLYTGFLLWRTDLYGAFASDYQTCWGTNPFDDSGPSAVPGKDMDQPAMLTYPSANGVIDTVQWEAAREGVTDVRYLTTFYAALRECKDNHLVPDLIQASQAQVTGFLNKSFWELSDSDYQLERQKIAHYAILLRQSVDGYYKKKGMPVY